MRERYREGERCRCYTALQSCCCVMKVCHRLKYEFLGDQGVFDTYPRRYETPQYYSRGTSCISASRISHLFQFTIRFALASADIHYTANTTTAVPPPFPTYFGAFAWCLESKGHQLARRTATQPRFCQWGRCARSPTQERYFEFDRPVGNHRYLGSRTHFSSEF